MKFCRSVSLISIILSLTASSVFALPLSSSTLQPQKIFDENKIKTADERLQEMIELLLPLERKRHHALKDWQQIDENHHAKVYEGKLEYWNDGQGGVDHAHKGEISFHFYRAFDPSGGGREESYRAPVLLLFPPILGFFPFEATICKFCSLGVSSLVAYPQEDFMSGEFELKEVNAVVARTTFSNVHLMDWLTSLSSVNPEKISLFGISLGGIRASMVMGVDPRPKSAVLVVTGGNIPEILAYSKQKRARHFRDVIMEKEGIQDANEFFQLLKESMLLDPLSFAQNRPSHNYFMIMSDSDEVVPSKNQVDLWMELGKPRSRHLTFGHFWTAVSSAYYYREIVEFLFEGWNKNQKMDDLTAERLEMALKTYFP